ncbi:MAG: ArsR family transcriptional regulator, arsenate/arsenite/antimonite-responsive transcriptional [Actinomycetota bacterium]|jgi:ArsR family transcriptional regulator|nr:ArsR family transcriptional regulator, arsenate/arsenite/antimonite-responsive transcriptional [Actinomycetota bacterium]
MTSRAAELNVGPRPPDALPSLDDRLLRLLADPLRARLVSLLAGEQLCTCHLAQATGALPSAVSNQLRHLREAGVVEPEAAGRFTYYRLRPEMLAGLGEHLTALATAARAAEKRPC